MRIRVRKKTKIKNSGSNVDSYVEIRDEEARTY